jgi:hypothetical protein
MGRGKRAEWGMGTGRTRSSNGARDGASLEIFLQEVH